MRVTLVAALALLLVASAAAARPAAKPNPLPLQDGYCLTKAERAKVVRFRAGDGVRLLGVQLGTGTTGVVLGHEYQETPPVDAVRADARPRRDPRARVRPSRLRLVCPRPRSVPVGRSGRDRRTAPPRRPPRRRGRGVDGRCRGDRRRHRGAGRRGLRPVATRCLRRSRRGCRRSHVRPPAPRRGRRPRAGLPRGGADSFQASPASAKSLELPQTGFHGTDILRGGTLGAALRAKLVAFVRG